VRDGQTVDGGELKSAIKQTRDLREYLMVVLSFSANFAWIAVAGLRVSKHREVGSYDKNKKRCK
jgi:hypothetical protein